MSPHRIVMIRDGGNRRAPAVTRAAALAEPLSHALGRMGYEVKLDSRSAIRRRHPVPDLVHAFDWAGGVAAGTVLGGACPVVVTPAAIQPEPGAVEVVDRVVTSSSTEFEQLLRLGVPRSKIIRVSSAVDTELFQPGPGLVGKAARRRTPAKVLAIGGSCSPTALGQLLQALVRVPDAELVVAGLDRHDELAEALLGYAARLPGMPRVRLLGQVPAREMPELYRSVDVLTHLADSGSGAVLEAMSCGVPVVAHATADTSETIVDGVTGVLVRPSDLSGLTRALRMLLSDNILRMGMACAAADRVRSRFSWSRVAIEMDQVYRSMLGADGEAAEVEPADVEPADVEPADGEPADGEPADVEPADVSAADAADDSPEEVISDERSTTP